jgi:hypothetical protein
VVKITGSWLEEIAFNSVPYWTLKDDKGFKVIEEENPLPSDVRYRLDLQALARGDLEEAQRLKEEMEENQRNDRKLRKSMGGALH